MFNSPLKHVALLRRPAPPFAPAGTLQGTRSATRPSWTLAPRADVVDETLADSFPASDPPAWTAGIARVEPLPGASRAGTAGASESTRSIPPEPLAVPIVMVSTPDAGSVTVRSAVLSVLGAVGLALAAPFVILLVGLPLALLVRVLADVVSLAFTLGL